MKSAEQEEETVDRQDSSVFFGLQVYQVCGLTCGVCAARAHSVLNKTKLKDDLTSECLRLCISCPLLES